MKDLYTKKLSGPPLEHDDWVELQAKLDAEANGEQSQDEEPTFHDKPLSFYADLTDDQILAIKGIGKTTLGEIRAAQAGK